MGAGTRSDPIYFPDAAHPPLQNLYTRRLSKSGTMATIKPVTSKDLADGYYYEAAQDRAEHRDFPNPHNYTVRVMNREDFHNFGCRCANGCKWDPVTQQAEVRCRCGNYSFDPGDYVGESEDNDKLYMILNLASTTVVASESIVRVSCALAGPSPLVALSNMRCVQAYSPARVRDVRAVLQENRLLLIIDVHDRNARVTASEIDVVRLVKRRRML
jgi:hypothetical protein